MTATSQMYLRANNTCICIQWLCMSHVHPPIEAAVPSPPGLLAALAAHTDAIFACDDACGGHTNKQTMVHNTHGVFELCCCCCHIRDGLLEVQVHNVIAVVGDCWLLTIHLIV